MRRLLAPVAVSVLLLAILLPSARAAESVDGIAAVVNGDIITYSEVRDVVGPREKLLRSQYSGQELIDKIKEARRAALQDLIDRQLIIQDFNKEKFQIPPHFIDEHVDTTIRESFGGDRNTFIKTLQAQNYTLSKFRDLERDKIIVQAWRAKNVKSNLFVPPNKITEYYAQHKKEFSSKEEVKLRMIMIPGQGNSGNSAAQKAMVEEIRAKIITGADFDRMAQMYSEDATRDLGGDWGWIDRKTLSEPLSNAAFGLKLGEVSQVVDVSGNYYLLKVEGRHDAIVRSLKEVRADIEKKLQQEEAQRLQEHWHAGLRAKAYIKTF
jgi:peptidyl-prolyl cis-trans isomerase SurA